MSKTPLARNAAVMALAALALACSVHSRDSRAAQTAAPPAPVVLFNVLPIKSAAFAQFLPVMQANARASRLEQGNQSFDVFQPEDGTPTLYLLERWSSQEALDAHMTQPNLKAVEERAKTDFSGEATSIRLTAVAGLGPESRKPFPSSSAAAGSRNVIVRFAVKPEQEQAFLEAMAEVTPHSLRAPGNRAFELYRLESQPQAYLLFERWDSVADHQAHLSQAYSKRADAAFATTLAAPPAGVQARDAAAE